MLSETERVLIKKLLEEAENETHGKSRTPDYLHGMMEALLLISRHLVYAVERQERQEKEDTTIYTLYLKGGEKVLVDAGNIDQIWTKDGGEMLVFYTGARKVAEFPVEMVEAWCS